MAEVIFYEKPGCVSNTRQKKLLTQAGHTLITKNLLNENWAVKKSYLRKFFGRLPIVDWFNKSAPAIKQQLITPSQLNEDEAIAHMIQDPLLIRRPLMQVGEHMMAGFDESKLSEWFQLKLSQSQSNLEQCPKADTAAKCDEN